jgi:Dolichyl-phosphate-mannose-protein mannosyltransferase
MIMVEREQNSRLVFNQFNRLTIIGIAFVSAIYFADIFLKASRKLFWFDELFAFYLCRLPTFRDTWSAVTRGADFNPPLFYLLTRFTQRLFGDGLIGTRLPEIIGVWLFCICLFLFVARRTGVISGFIAGAFPFFTLAQYYAYEARAHGMVLGWCGLTLLCWQRNDEGRARYLWLTGFGLSLAGALLTHVCAIYLLVPFAVVEGYSFLVRARVNWGIVTVMALVSSSVILVVYRPLFLAYRSTMSGAFAAASHDVFDRFLVHVIGPGTMILLLWLLLRAWDGKGLGGQESTRVFIPAREVVLALGFAGIPLMGLLGAKISHGPFFDRYFLSSIAAYAIALGFVTCRGHAWPPRVLAGCMFALMIGDLGATIHLSMKQRIVMREPTGGPRLSTDPSNPMKLYDTVTSDKSGLDILVLPAFEYIYFFKYAPPSIVPRLYFGASEDDVFFTAYKRIAKGARLELKVTTFEPFLVAHDRFLLYEVRDRVHVDALQAIANKGYRLISTRADTAGVMYEYMK